MLAPGGEERMPYFTHEVVSGDAYDAADKLDAILDAYVEKSSVHYVSKKTGIDTEDIRVLFCNGDIANQAASRKMTQCAVWFVGIGMDAIQDALLDPETPLKERMTAVRLMKDIMVQFQAHPLTKAPPSEPVPKQIEGSSTKPLPVVVPAPTMEEILEGLGDE